MFSKENRPGFGTAILMSLPLFAGCSPSPGEGLSLAPHGEQTMLTSDQVLAERLLERLSHPKSAEHAELAGKAYDAYKDAHARYDGGDPNALYNSATELRDFILKNRNSAFLREDSILFDDATSLLIKSGPAIDMTYYHQTLGDRAIGGSGGTSNSNIAHLAEFKMACATVIYDCTLP